MMTPTDDQPHRIAAHGESASSTIVLEALFLFADQGTALVIEHESMRTATGQSPRNKEMRTESNHAARCNIPLLLVEHQLGYD